MNFKALQIRLNRLRAMSPAEAMHRVIRLFKTRWDKQRVTHRGSDVDVGSILVTEALLDQLENRFVFLWQQVPTDEFHSRLKENFPAECEAILSHADELLEHRFHIFGREFKFGDKIDWHRDLLSGKQIPINFWSDVNFWDKKTVTEVKYIWELNRHQHFVTFAQAYFISDDKKYADELFKQWCDWVEANPPKFGVNWTSSLEMALRLVSWIWALHIVKNNPALDEDIYIRILNSVDAHARFIEKHLSRFSSANNHLIGEGLGLIYAGTYFPELKHSKRWQKLGFDIVFREIPKQVYKDGVSKEQAIHYQRYIFDFGLLAIQAAQHANITMPEDFRNRLEKMAEFILYLMDSEGNVPSIGDEDGGQVLYLSVGSRESCALNSPYRSLLCSAAILFNRGDFKQAAGMFDHQSLWLFGIDGARRFDELEAVDTPLGSKTFPQGGYHVVRSMDENGERVMTFDTGQLGYGSLAAHGHADALSITLSCYGEAVLIDSGTYLYLGAGDWRDYFRSTVAHNTVTIEGKSQSEMLGPFQWGKKAKAKLIDYREDRNFAYLEGAIRGFFRGKLSVVHNRRIGFLKPNVWIIRDVLQGKGQHQVALHFHLGPGHTKVDITEQQVICQFEKSELTIKLLFGNNLKIEVSTAQEKPPLGWCSSAFGHHEPCSVVRISGYSQLPCSVTTMLHSRAKELV